MNCEDSRTYRSAYLDDELDVATLLRMQEHLNHCADCRLDEEEQLVLRTALRDPALYAPAAPDFAKRMQVLLRRTAEETRPRGPAWLTALRFEPRWIPAGAFAVIVGTAIGMLTIANLRSSDQQLIAAAVVTSHIRSLQAGHLVDVPSSDRHTVKPWFQGKLDFAPPVPDLSDLGWPLIGGRLDYVDRRPVAALVYQSRLHNINVFIWPNLDTADNAVKQQDAQGYQILHWNGADMTYWIVSDLNRNELIEFARALRGH